MPMTPVSYTHLDVYKRQVDTDGDGVLNNGETLLPQDYRFTAAAVITAHFEENPDAWIQIAFEAGSHGSINAGQPLTPVSYTHLNQTKRPLDQLYCEGR